MKSIKITDIKKGFRYLNSKGHLIEIIERDGDLCTFKYVHAEKLAKDGDLGYKKTYSTARQAIKHCFKEGYYTLPKQEYYEIY